MNIDKDIRMEDINKEMNNNKKIEVRNMEDIHYNLETSIQIDEDNITIWASTPGGENIIYSRYMVKLLFTARESVYKVYLNV